MKLDNSSKKSVLSWIEINPENAAQFLFDLKNQLDRLEKSIENSVGNFDNVLFTKKEVAKMVTNKNSSQGVCATTVRRWVKNEQMFTVDGRLISGKEIKRFCSQNDKYNYVV